MGEIKTYPNQRILEIKKSPCDDKKPENKYTKNNLEALEEMVKTLTEAGSIKLYLYIAKNQETIQGTNWDQMALSSKDFCSWAGVSKPTYIEAFKDLEEKGFLVRRSEESNRYTFYDRPIKNELDEVIIEKPENHKWEEW